MRIVPICMGKSFRMKMVESQIAISFNIKMENRKNIEYLRWINPSSYCCLEFLAFIYAETNKSEVTSHNRDGSVGENLAYYEF